MVLTLMTALALSGAPRFVEDDYAKALSQARAAKKLLLVDAWAPWCHTCVFMREHVLNQPAFGAYEKDILFAAIDTEKAQSAAFLEKFPVAVWPTFFFIDPATEKVVFKWVGSTDEAQMKALLEAARGGTGLQAEADALLTSGDTQHAVEKYRAVLASTKGASASDSDARLVLSMLSALTLSHDEEACAQTTVDQLPTLKQLQHQVMALGWGLSCALDVKAPERRAQLVPVLVKESLRVVADPAIAQVLADDVSSVYESLVQERVAAAAPDEAQRLATDWLAFLDARAAEAKTPAARAAFDAHRTGAAIAAKVPEKMVEPLKLSERQLPNDYNASARLAVIERELGHYDAGLAAIERALSRCKSGPRKLRLYDTKISLLEKKGDAASAKKVLAEAVAWARKLPKAQVSPERVAALEQRLANASKPAQP